MDALGLLHDRCFHLVTLILILILIFMLIFMLIMHSLRLATEREGAIRSNLDGQ